MGITNVTNLKNILSYSLSKEILRIKSQSAMTKRIYLFFNFPFKYCYYVFALSLLLMFNASNNVNKLNSERSNGEFHLDKQILESFLFKKKSQNINFLYVWNVVLNDMENKDNIVVLNKKIIEINDKIIKITQDFAKIRSNSQCADFLYEKIQHLFKNCRAHNKSLEVLARIESFKYENTISRPPDLKDSLKHLNCKKILFASEFKDDFTLFQNVPFTRINDLQKNIKKLLFEILNEFEGTIFTCVTSRHSITFIMLFYDLLKYILSKDQLENLNNLDVEFNREKRIQNYLENIRNKYQSSEINIEKQRSFIADAYFEIFNVFIIDSLKKDLEVFKTDKMHLMRILENFTPFFVKLNKFLCKTNASLIRKVDKNEELVYDNTLVIFILDNLFNDTYIRYTIFKHNRNDFHYQLERLNTYFFSSITPSKKLFIYQNTSLFYFISDLIELNFYLLSATMDSELVLEVFSDIVRLI